MPCKNGAFWEMPSFILDRITHDLSQVLLECLPPFQALSYLMATFKQQKAKYRWLTNAHNTVFSNITLLLTITSIEILKPVKTWAHTKVSTYKNFLQVDTSFYWIVNSIIDTTLNLPSSMHDIYVADISRCYETIPLIGPDNLLQATTFLISIAFKQASLAHPRAHTNLWIRTIADGTLAAAKWAT